MQTTVDRYHVRCLSTSCNWHKVYSSAAAFKKRQEAGCPECGRQEEYYRSAHRHDLEWQVQRITVTTETEEPQVEVKISRPWGHARIETLRRRQAADQRNKASDDQWEDILREYGSDLEDPADWWKSDEEEDGDG